MRKELDNKRCFRVYSTLGTLTSWAFAEPWPLDEEDLSYEDNWSCETVETGEKTRMKRWNIIQGAARYKAAALDPKLRKLPTSHDKPARVNSSVCPGTAIFLLERTQKRDNNTFQGKIRPNKNYDWQCC